jgi:hypothetical protein
VAEDQGIQTHPASQKTVPDGVFVKIRERIVGFAKHLGCRDESEDIAQETMVVLSRRYSELSEEDLIRLRQQNLFQQGSHHGANVQRLAHLMAARANHRKPILKLLF